MLDHTAFISDDDYRQSELIGWLYQFYISEKKDEVEILTEEKDRAIVVTVVLDPSDMGKVIGKQGKIAKALRTLVRAATPKNSKKYNVEIKEREENA